MAVDIVSGIYEIKNQVTGKVYIGSAINTRRRINQHIRELRSGRHGNFKLQRSWIKHGEYNFSFTVIDVVDDKLDLVRKEQYFIDLNDASNKGYNIAPKAYSALGIKFTREIKDKISAAMKGKLAGKPWTDARRLAHHNHWKGRKHSAESLVKMSEAQKGRVVSDSAKRSMSLAGKNRKPITDETRSKLSKAGIGRVFSEETKRKISECHLGKKRKPLSAEHKEIISVLLKGKKKPPRSEEHSRRISEAKKGKPGHKMTPETIAKMIETRKRNCKISSKSLNGKNTQIHFSQQ